MSQQTDNQDPKEPEDQQPRVIPLSTFQSLITPSNNLEIPFAKTYRIPGSDVRWFSRSLPHSYDLALTFSKTISKNLDSDVKVLDKEFEKCTLDTTLGKPSLGELEHRVHNERVDFTGIIYGDMNGVIRTLRVIGQILIRDRTSFINVLPCGDWGRLQAIISPAFISALAYITDEATLKAQRNISSQFLGTLTDTRNVGAVCANARHYVHRGVNCVRFSFRLAVLYVYARFCCLRGTEKCMLYSNDDVDFVDASDWLTWSTEVLNFAGCRNYVPWTIPGHHVTHRDFIFYEILSFACRDKVSIGIEGQRAVPIVWPQIHKPTLIGTFPPTQTFNSIAHYSPEQILEVSLNWNSRYGCIDQFKEMVKLVSILYWGTEHFNLTCIGNTNSMLLPEADMNAFILAPIIQSIEGTQTLSLSDYKEEPLLMAYKSAQLALILNFVRQYQQYINVDAALEMNIFTYDHEKHGHMRVLQRICLNTSVPIWDAAQKCWTTFGLKGEIGTVISSIALMDGVRDYEKFVQSIAGHRVSSFDIAPYFTSLPEDLAVARWVGTIPMDGLLDLETNYRLGEFTQQGPMKVMRCVGELAGIRGILIFCARSELYVTSRYVKFVHCDERGLPRDFGQCAVILRDGSQVAWGFKIKSLNALLAASEHRHDRYNLNWYYTSDMAINDLEVEKMHETRDDPEYPAIIFNCPDLSHEESVKKLKTQAREIFNRMCGGADQVLKEDTDSDSSHHPFLNWIKKQCPPYEPKTYPTKERILLIDEDNLTHATEYSLDGLVFYNEQLKDNVMGLNPTLKHKVHI
ncbi:hypothetical protein RF11_12294 [Thelohanellus kitauei]|uniref:Uncharacterized protein n=1 Tax=Thelohanellus kitauei TaxID=669202 RepID=A0A0C2J4W1_THEKT|nr:hypothetical protein RF11_12294 [Thelohanellus kitauei]